MKIFTALVSFLLCFILHASAQTNLSEVSLEYAVESLSKSNAVASTTFRQSIWIKSHLSKSVFNGPSGSETVIYDARSKSGVILREYAAQKILIELNESDWNDYLQSSKAQDFKQGNEQKQLGEYSCWKATGTNGNLALTIWYTQQFRISHAEYGLYYPALNGLPVQIETCQKNECLRYELKSLKTESIPSSVFEYNKKDYRIIQYKATKKG
jgi:GLPGLI family protein